MAENLVNSVKKSLDILDILVFDKYSDKGVGLFDLSRLTGIKPNTLHNLLKTMIVCGYVQQNSESKYLAGPKCSSIGIMNKLSPGSSTLNQIECDLKELSNNICESVIFAILSEGNRIGLLRIDCDSPFKIDFSMLEDEHIYSKDTGRVLAAYADKYALETIIAKNGLPGEKWNNIKDTQSFHISLKEIQKNGYSLTLLSEKQVVSMAVPVLYKDGKLFGALGSHAPIYRCDNQKQNEIIDKMKSLAEKLMNFI